MQVKKRFSSETLEQIKQRVSLKDVISRHVTGLTRKGKDWWACCPFHHEKTPSFHIHEARGYYHCFGCGAHGNVFDFVQEMRGGSFSDAVIYLADLTGVQLEEVRLDPKVEAFKNDGYKALDSAAKFYRSNLKNDALDYFVERGLSENIIKEFGLGYAPDAWRSLGDHLSQQGVSKRMLLETGLSVDGEKGLYDRFRHRVMFPIQNLEGKVVGFGGRVLDGGEPKYLNSSETKFFNKRYTLYNLNRARESIRRESRALIVEGYMDVIGLYAHGVKSAIAPLGTAITEDQIKLLWRFHDAPTVCLDGDRAGRGAAVRVAKRVLTVLAPNKTLKFAWMPEGEDPDSYIAKQGKDAFDKLVSKTASLEDVLWFDLTEGRSLKSGEDRAAIEKSIEELAATMPDESLKRHLTRALKERIWQKEKKKNEQSEKVTLKRRGADDEQARILLSILFKKTELLEKFSEKLSEVSIVNQRLRVFNDTLFKVFSAGRVETSVLHAYLADIGLLEEMKKVLASDIVDRIDESHLESLWLDVYGDLTQGNIKQERLTRKQATEDLFSANADDAWQKLKELHAQRKKVPLE